MQSWQPNIYQYLDYRAYLRDFYEAGKAHTSFVSFRYLSRQAGFTSPNYYKLVMDGERNLTASSRVKFADALKLRGEARDFFFELVEFGQADTDQERNAVYENIASRQQFRRARHIDQSMFEYLSNWYHPVIREMVARQDFREDPEWIGKELFPQVAPRRVQESLELLLDLGLLQRSESGELLRGEPTWTTGHEVRSLAIANYHRQMLQRAAESIELVDSSRRHLSAITACIDEVMVEEVKERVNAFRENIIHLLEQEANPRKVYQLNIQFFPLSQVEGKE